MLLLSCYDRVVRAFFDLPGSCFRLLETHKLHAIFRRKSRPFDEARMRPLVRVQTMGRKPLALARGGV